ncbi:MAG: methylenetetrahydrofolate reductase, partial [Thermodesulfobacteriota bacterium]|nr:methylenetetrahydrofolate reductase [Thermodesulfobacteriota bacterium]
MKELPRRPLSHFSKSLLNPDEFTLTFELVPSRGGRGWKHDRILEMARLMADDGRIRAVSITDNAGGHPALSPEVFGLDILEMGLDVINHFSCKDKNRNQMESLLFGWDRAGLTSLLVISGDYPKRGYCGHPKPVFDLDSVQVVEMLNHMNQGNFEGREISATSFFKGVAISPFKYTEAEQMMQYFKLHRKVAAGADFAITQVGFDVRKFQELLFFMEQN